jgi:hypothetical protein
MILEDDDMLRLVVVVVVVVDSQVLVDVVAPAVVRLDK